MVRLTSGESPSQWKATLSATSVSIWRSRQLELRLSLPPSNQRIFALAKSWVWTESHFLNQVTRSATSAQKASESSSERRYISLYWSMLEIHACCWKLGGTSKTLPSRDTSFATFTSAGRRLS